MRKPGRAVVAIDQLHPGWKVDREIMVDNAVLVTAGVTLTERMIGSFRRRGIETIEISQDSELVQGFTPSERTDALAELLDSASSLYDIHGVELAIPPQVMEHATDEVEEFFTEIELGQEIDYDKIHGVVRRLVEVFSERSRYAIKLLDLDRFDRYTYRHSINVGLLMTLIASDWVESREELEDVMFGSVLHDIGKAKVGSAIINKPGKLDDEEWAIMHQHSIWSAEMLAEAEASPRAVEIARHHHERLDGNGYPDALPGEMLDRYVRLSSICDVYDALTTKRSYKNKMDFAKAMDIILQNCGTQFDPDIAHEFIRRVGRYPVGTFVKLSSNEIAVVVRINENAISRPVVSRVMHLDGALTDHGEELDLSQQNDLFIAEILVHSTPV